MFVFAPEEQHLYSLRVFLVCRSVRSDMWTVALLTERKALSVFGYKHLAPTELHTKTLSQSRHQLVFALGLGVGTACG